MIRLYNGKVLTLREGQDTPVDGEVWVEGDRIVLAGIPEDSEVKPVFEREIDLKGGMVMPGMKNAHTHSAMTFLRSFADDYPLDRWLNEMIFPREAKLDGEAVYAFAKLANLEYLAGGVTAAFDMYFYRDDYVQACIDTGFRSVMCGALMAWDPDWTVLERDYEKYSRIHPLIGYLPGAHAEYTASLDMLKYILSVCRAEKLPFYAHNSETAKEVRECRERHGMSPTALFESLGLYEYGGGGFHWIWTDENDVEIFKKRNLWAVSCPCSNAKLASGIAPLNAYRKAGVNLALGTDGPSSNNALDMFREMYLACVLQKLKEEDAAAMDPVSVLRMACCCGARAMGLADCDCLAPGKQADLCVIDMDKPAMVPLHNAVKNLVYSGNPGCVKLTMIAGRVLYENGEFFVDEPAEDILAAARAHTKRIIEA